MKKIVSLATVLLIVTSCTDVREDVLNEVNTTVTISASAESSSDARSSATDEGVFLWTSGDAIAVYTNRSAFREFTVKYPGADGSNTGEFIGELDYNETPTGYAVYPYNDGHQLNGDKLTFKVPSIYGNYNADVANTNAAMFAQIEEGSENYHFCHLGGVWRFLLDNVPANTAQFVFTAKDKDITGNFEVDLSEAEPVIKAREKSSANSLTIKIKPLSENKNGMKFFVPLPIGEYNGFTITLKRQDGTTLAIVDSNKTFTVTRAQLGRFPAKQLSDVVQNGESYANGVVRLNAGGRLFTVLGGEEVIKTVTSLKVIGPINGYDIRTLRLMLNGYDSEGSSWSGNLTTLDLSQAIIVTNGGEYFAGIGALDDVWYLTVDNEISSMMFSGCGGLKEITLPNNACKIFSSAFSDCENLEIIRSHQAVSPVLEQFSGAMGGNDAVLRIPQGAKDSYKSAGWSFYFSDDRIVEEVSTLNGTVAYLVKAGDLQTALGDQMLTLTSLKIVGNINGTDIKCLRQMMRAPYELDNNGYYQYDEKYGALTELDMSETNILSGGESFFNNKGTEYFTSDNSIENVFGSCSQLEEIKLPNNLISIGKEAFGGCLSLVSVVLPEGLQSIGEYAFNGCAVLPSVAIPTNVTTIGKSAFWGCNALTSIVIPSGVTSLDNVAFAYCPLLTEIICTATTPPNLGQSVFQGVNDGAKIYVPNSAVDIYKKRWSDYTSMITPIGN